MLPKQRSSHTANGANNNNLAPYEGWRQALHLTSPLHSRHSSNDPVSTSWDVDSSLRLSPGTSQDSKGAVFRNLEPREFLLLDGPKILRH